MTVRDAASAPPGNGDYHRSRAARERELAARADDPSAMRAHAKLAELHEAQAGAARTPDGPA